MANAKQLSRAQLIACGVDQDTALVILPQINHWLATLPPVACWQRLIEQILTPDRPFALHHLLYTTTFADWDIQQGPPPVWVPTEAQIQQSHIAALMRQLNLATYPELHHWSVQHRAQFWQVMIERLGIRLQEPYTEILDLSLGAESPQWLVNARLNIVESCFQAAEDATAILFQTAAEALQRWSYGELLALTNRVANGLVEAGLQPGDAIAIAMPMTPESVAIYLGIVKAGGIVVSIADSFAANEIATRLRIANAKAIFTQDGIQRTGKRLPLYEKVMAANAPLAIVLPCDSALSVDLRCGDLPWNVFLSDNDRFAAVPANPSAYTNILFSSGTTGDPKAIPWTQTTPIKCAADGHLHQDIHAGDVVAWPTNLGWMMGPWLLYASLINRGTIALYNDAPTTREFGQFIQDAHVTMLGVVPSLVSCWRASNCMQGLDWSAIKAFSSTGECSNPQDMLWLMALAGYKPVIEYCGGTEIGGGYITGTVVQPAAPATFTTPALGLDLVTVDGDGQPANKGEVFIIPPSIGLSTELLNKNHHQTYFADTPHLPGCLMSLRRHGDRLERLPNGFYRAHGRVDDTMNLGGIKVSTVEIESVLITIEGVQEAAAIAVSPENGGPSQLVVYVVVAPELQPYPEPLQLALQNAIRNQLNPLFKIQDLVVVETLPRTASHKLMRRVLREQYQQGLVVQVN
ncbi:MAG: AMP-binding protein [Elainellaceae cyanobacterium]